MERWKLHDSAGFTLHRYDISRSRDAFFCIIDWAANFGGDVHSANNSTTRLNHLCRIVSNASGKFAAAIFPDFEATNGNVLMVHSVLSEVGVRAPKAQVSMFRQYITEMFQTFGFNKVAIEFPSFARLNVSIAKRVGMVQEGCLREEWEFNGKRYDVLRYSILRSEWEKYYYGS